MAIAISERLFYSPIEGPFSLLGAEVKIISDISKTDQGRVHQFGTEGLPGMMPLELGESWTGDLLTMPPSEIHVKKGSNQQKWKFAEESVNLSSHDWRIFQEGQPLSTTAQSGQRLHARIHCQEEARDPDPDVEARQVFCSLM